MDIPKAVLETMPAMPPPPGVFPSFDDPGRDGSNATWTIAIMAAIASFTLMVLLLRLYTRFVILKNPGLDESLSVGTTSLAIYVFKHGFGYHQWDVRMSTLISLTNVMNAALYIYMPCMLMAKLSLCVTYLRIFGDKPKLKWAIYLAMAYNAVLHVTVFFLCIFLCIPGRPQFWKCGHRVSLLNVVAAYFNIVADFYLLCLPLLAIRSLHMSVSRKLGVSAIFMVGIIACVASILGLIYRIDQTNSLDITWNFSKEDIVAVCEINATILVGCFPILPALFRSNHPYSFGSLWGKSVQATRSLSLSVSNWRSKYNVHSKSNSVSEIGSYEEETKAATKLPSTGSFAYPYSVVARVSPGQVV